MDARKLPVLGTALKGWLLLAQDWWVLLRIILLPLAVLVALDFYLAALWEAHFEGAGYRNLDYADDAMTILMNLDLALALLLSGFVVALWHRGRVTGRHSFSLFGLLAAWRNIAALTVHWCGLVLITMGLTWVIGSLRGRLATDSLNKVLIKKLGLMSHPALYRVLTDLILDAVPLLIAFYISGRLALMLWARPGGGDGALDRAWDAGAGNGWRIAAAIFLAILPVAVVESALPPVMGAGYDVAFVLLRHDLANLLQLIVAVGVIAAAHQTLLGGGDASEVAVPTKTTGL